MQKQILLSIIMLFFALFNLQAQESEGYLMPCVVENGEKIFLGNIKEATVVGHSSVRSKRDWRQYYKMVYNLKRVYPYTQIARHKMAEIDAHYTQLKTRKERKDYIDKVEKEMLAEFEGPLRKLTISQGKMLIRLIDRETGRSSYAVVKEFKGGFTTFFWQNIGKLFGYNLKTRYDARGEDAILEELVLMCENGTFDDLYYSMYPN